MLEIQIQLWTSEVKTALRSGLSWQTDKAEMAEICEQGEAGNDGELSSPPSDLPPKHCALNLSSKRHQVLVLDDIKIRPRLRCERMIAVPLSDSEYLLIS